MNIIKIGSVELTEEEAFRLYQSGKYIVAYKRIYQLMYSQAQGRVYGQQIFYKGKEGLGLTRRGRFHTMSGKQVNHLLGFQLVNE